MNKNKTILISIITICSLIIPFKGEIIGACIEKANYYRDYHGTKLINGEVKQNFMYTSNGDIGGISYANYSVKDTSSGIVYNFDMQDIVPDYSGHNRNVLITFDGDEMPDGKIKG